MEQGPESAAPPPEISGEGSGTAAGARAEAPDVPVSRPGLKPDTVSRPADYRSLPVFQPPNRAIEWYRFLLWMMPTCVALTTIVGFAWLVEELGFRQSGVVWGCWWVFNIAAAIGAGIFDLKLAHPRWKKEAVRVEPVKVLTFVVLQAFIVPLLGLVIVAVCSLAWRF
ncbi:MAG: hypothetical protein EOP83_13920 [Verrucomicrobiaceae bacterium]|nr:MAG: hypothetical protein EOP83_13920 [Verrucomicrobiaceae bacterium]